MNNDAKALRIELAYAKSKLISNEILHDKITELEQENAALKKEITKLRSNANAKSKPTTDTGVVSGS